MPFYPLTSSRAIEDAANDPACDHGESAARSQVDRAHKLGHGDLFAVMGAILDKRECENQ